MKVIKEIEHGSIINVTSRGIVVAKLVPPGNSREEAKYKLKKVGKHAVLGDLITPIGSKWEALNNVL
ncbi:MAG: type II toxin-antitoxin system prevent-host-death family antitoxin [Ignavibacteriaceae bacterium]